jgi:hypothetical protein
LRGLDLNQRPLGYECETAMTGNPLISREKRSMAGTSIVSVHASFLLVFGPDPGSHGSKIGAAATQRVTRAAPSSTGDALAADTTRVEALHAFDDGDDLLIYERRLAANEALHSDSSL